MQGILQEFAGPRRHELELAVRLYLVVLGRPPDEGGLRANLARLSSGTPLRELVTDMMASDEFAARAGGRDAASVMTAQFTGIALPAEPDPASLGSALIQDPAVQQAFPLLPALFPDGVPLTTDNYQAWLARDGAAPPSRLRVSVLVRAGDAGSSQVIRAARAARALGPHVDVVVVTRRLALRLRLLAQPGVRVGADDTAGLALCRGEFVLPVKGTDVPRALPPDPGGAVDLVLMDADRLDESGVRCEPTFGAAWDPERSAARGFDGAVMVRRGLAIPATVADVVASIPESRIRHVPVVAVSHGARSEPGDPAPAALFPREPGGGGAPLDRLGTPQVRSFLPSPDPSVAIVVPTRDRPALLRRCAATLLGTTDYRDYELVIVDNGSTDPVALALLAELEADGRVRLLRWPGPFNWAAMNNAAVAATRAEVIVLLNNDIEVIERGWLREMVSLACRPSVGAVGAKLLYPDGTLQHAGVVLAPNGHALHCWRGACGSAAGYDGALDTRRRVSAVTGACLALRRAVFEAVGGCDAEQLPVTWNDVDLCLKVRAAGFQVLWTPFARLLHLEQASRGTDDTPERDARFRREQSVMLARWGDGLRDDPFWSPNLLPYGTEARLDPAPRLRWSASVPT